MNNNLSQIDGMGVEEDNDAVLGAMHGSPVPRLPWDPWELQPDMDDGTHQNLGDDQAWIRLDPPCHKSGSLIRLLPFSYVEIFFIGMY
ncbi:hypothetical protein AVEN_250466-1 [Araneus ventricosus]|uniref:Uncharacterized protein n=1 Tax=Araneus ventricosus TaxID=182803 RepID=A0A4Y2UPE0_ARAVE|nr:hypothetical protein AVEN_250466-1 [Araneus ventricosus]